MTIIYVLLALWLGLVIGHAIGRVRSRYVLVSDPDFVTSSVVAQILHKSLWEISATVDAKRPQRLWMRAKFKLYMDRPRGTAYIWVHENIDDLSTWELNDGDPSGKIEAAVARIIKRLEPLNILGFVDQQLPSGIDMCYKVTDATNNVQVRLLRGFDIIENVFITQVSVKVVVKS